jgi:NADH-quinone oxidoreductase subunit M
MIQRTYFGPRPQRFDDVEDAGVIDLIPVVVLVTPIVLVGVWPSLITDTFDVGIQAMLG